MSKVIWVLLNAITGVLGEGAEVEIGVESMPTGAEVKWQSHRRSGSCRG